MHPPGANAGAPAIPERLIPPEYAERLRNSAGELPSVERTETRSVLSRLNDPRPEVTTCAGMEFCFVPAGEFWMGEGQKIHKLHLPPYWIGRYPVTQAQFGEFVAAGGYGEARYWAEAQKRGHCYWSQQGFRGRWDDAPRQAPERYGEQFELLNHPVVGISWYEALAFSHWLGEHFRQRVLLPSEAEWEKASRGGLEIPAAPLVRSLAQGFDLPTAPLKANPQPQRVYPWGDDADPEKANYGASQIGATSAVGAFPAGASPYGVLDLSGNIWEWTRSDRKDYPYDPQDGREDLTKDDGRVLRGGSYLDNSRLVRCAKRSSNFSRNLSSNQGFRLRLLAS